MNTTRSSPRSVAIILAVLFSTSGLAHAQGASSQSGQPAATFQLPTLIVTAQKQATAAQEFPVSLTAIAQPTLRDSGTTILSDLFAPNIYFTEFTARKLSN